MKGRTIYATDFNQQALAKAKEGIFSNGVMKEYTTNYQLSGGRESFSNYYTSQYDNVIMNNSLKKNIVWANHNLVTDSVFAEVHMIFCRNVLSILERNYKTKYNDFLITALLMVVFYALVQRKVYDYLNYAKPIATSIKSTGYLKRNIRS